MQRSNSTTCGLLEAYSARSSFPKCAFPYQATDTYQPEPPSKPDSSAAASSFNRQPSSAAHDEDDPHDWESFNRQIERLLQSVHKSDRAAYTSPSLKTSPQQSASRSAGRARHAPFPAISEHAEVRQNLAQSAFGLAAAVPSSSPTSSSSLTSSEQEAEASPAMRGLHIPCEEPLVRPQHAGQGETPQRSHSSYLESDARCHVTARENAFATAQILMTPHSSDAERDQISTAAASGRVERHGQQQEFLRDSPYLALVQQIDMHIASCDANLARMSPHTGARASLGEADATQGSLSWRGGYIARPSQADADISSSVHSGT